MPVSCQSVLGDETISDLFPLQLLDSESSVSGIITETREGLKELVVSGLCCGVLYTQQSITSFCCPYSSPLAPDRMAGAQNRSYKLPQIAEVQDTIW